MRKYGRGLIMTKGISSVLFFINLNYDHQVLTNAGSVHQTDTISTRQIFLQTDIRPL